MGCCIKAKEPVIEIKKKNNPPDVAVTTQVSCPKQTKVADNQVKEETNVNSKNSREPTIDARRLIKDSGKLEQHYKIMNKLGQGAFGSVYRVLHLKADLIRAMKMIKKTVIQLQDDSRKFLKEIEILVNIDHPNIIKIYEYFQDDTYFYVITEFVSGGELYDTISKWDSFNEEKAAYIMRQLLSAVSYLHANKIVHRDLKPENMMVEKNSGGKKGKNTNEINIKLIDFGTCNYYDGKNKLTLKVGTPYYIAPEVLKRSYTEKCDLWSCGVILYILLCGYPPFSGESTEEIIEAVMLGKYTMEGAEWKKISSDAKDLVSRLLEFRQDKRISAQDALNHKWIQDKMQAHKAQIDEVILSDVLKNLKSFNAKEKLQQATIAFIVHFQFASQENKELKKIFQEMDVNGDGVLTYKELKEGYYKLVPDCTVGVVESDLNKIIEILDGDKNGCIEYEEFLRIAIDTKNIITEKNLKLAFEKFDENQDGVLSHEEIKNILGSTDNDYIQEMIAIIDKDFSGSIDYHEFSEMMKKIISSHEEKGESKDQKKKVFNPTKTITDFSPLDKALDEKRSKVDKLIEERDSKTVLTKETDAKTNDKEFEY